MARAVRARAKPTGPVSAKVAVETGPTPAKSYPKQAVVVIHGIGEQVPLETLRGFVETVYQRDEDLHQGEAKERILADDPQLGEVNRVWIVPDDATGSAELRRISTPPNAKGVRTDFFEFYWADIMEGTPVEEVFGWLRGLILRSPFNVPPHLRVWLAWLSLWALTLLFLSVVLFIFDPSLALFGTFERLVRVLILAHRHWLGAGLAVVGLAMAGWRLLANRPPAEVPLTLPAALLVIGLLIALLPFEVVNNTKLWAAAASAGMAAALNGLIAPYAGDIVRYVRATPRTVEKRKAVRERGLALLKALHQRTDDGTPIYQRILVVGHSLGTIIGYDLLQLYWEAEGPNHKRDWAPDEGCKRALEAVDAMVKQTWPPDAGLGGATGLDIDDYQRRQSALFDAISASKLEWRISDFITLGSPLTHTDFLTLDGGDALERALEERLLSSAPPRPDRPSLSMLYYDWSPGRSAKRGPFPHFAAPFAAVRWTNIFDKHWLPLLGDIVSGPLRPAFGPGIREHQVAIERPGWLPVIRRLFTHTLYWAWHKSYDDHQVPEHIQLLRQALYLDGDLDRRPEADAEAYRSQE